MGSSAVWTLAAATFVACVVETVEAVTIVLAMGLTRSWRSTMIGVGTALVALAGFTAIAGYALTSWLPESALQLVIGGLLLIFGLQWMRKAILRSSGRKSLHDEAGIFAEHEAKARVAGDGVRMGLDWYSFVVSFKGVFLEGTEVVFIVITFGLNAHNIPVAVIAAAAAVVVVVAAAVVVHAPLTRVPENTLKYAVGLLLTTFGSFWAIEGLGVFSSGGAGLRWPGGELSLLGVLAGWFLLSQLLIAVLRRPAAPAATEPPEPAAVRAREEV